MSLKASAKTVTLRDLWGVLIRNIVAILLAALLITGIFVTVDIVSYTPMYQSTATLYILRQDNENASGSTVDSDFNLALKVVNDCDYILKTQDVVEGVMNTVQVNEYISYSEMVSRISITNPENTRILEVTVQSEDARLSQLLVNELCKQGAAKIESIMGFKQVTVSAEGRLDTQPCNKTSVLVYCLVGVASVLVMYIIFLIRFLLDDGIHSEEDVRRYLDLSVLGEIPDASGRHGRRRRYGGYYSRYGYGEYGNYGYGKYGYGYGQEPEKKPGRLAGLFGRFGRESSSDHAGDSQIQSRNASRYTKQDGSSEPHPTDKREPTSRDDQ